MLLWGPCLPCHFFFFFFFSLDLYLHFFSIQERRQTAERGERLLNWKCQWTLPREKKREATWRTKKNTLREGKQELKFFFPSHSQLTWASWKMCVFHFKVSTTKRRNFPAPLLFLKRTTQLKLFRLLLHHELFFECNQNVTQSWQWIKILKSNPTIANP